MKKSIIVLIIVFLSITCSAQVSLRGGMGIQFQSTPSLKDYLNSFFLENLGDFSSAVVFSLEGGYRVTENTELAVEAAYLLNSYNYTELFGQYEFSYGIIMPSIIYYYVISGAGYNFKFGGGAGIRLVSAEEKFPSSNPTEYTSTGYGLMLRFDGNTSIGGNFYANIGADLRYDINGELDSDGHKIRNTSLDENVNLNSFSGGIRLGITYQF